MNAKLIRTLTVLALLAPAAPARADWIDPNVLATDHRAYCSDIVATNTQADSGSATANDIGASDRRSDRYSQRQSSSSESTSVGGSFLGIGGNVGRNESESSRDTDRSSDRKSDTWDRSTHRTWDRSTTTAVTAGQNCDVFVQSAAQVEIAETQAETNQMAIEAKERTQVLQIETQAQQSMFESIMQGW